MPELPLTIATITESLQSFADSFTIGRWLFLRALGVVYALAFLSLMVQIRGLIGEQGILPLGEFLDGVRSRFGSRAYRMLPTLFWWRSRSAPLQGASESQTSHSSHHPSRAPASAGPTIKMGWMMISVLPEEDFNTFLLRLRSCAMEYGENKCEATIGQG